MPPKPKPKSKAKPKPKPKPKNSELDKYLIPQSMKTPEELLAIKEVIKILKKQGYTNIRFLP